MRGEATTSTGFYSENEIRDRLAISTFFVRGIRTLDQEILGQVRDSGIAAIEINEDPAHFALDDPGSMRDIKEACDDLELAVATYHTHQTDFEVDSEAERQERVDRCKRQIDTLLWMGGRVWGCHALVKTPATRESMEELLRHIEGLDVDVVVENFGLGQTIEDNAAFIDSVGHPQMGMIIDIGHVRNQEGQNPMLTPGGPTEKLRQAGSRLRHTHLHDFCDGTDHRSPFDGEMPWVEIFQALFDIDYGGLFHFEIAPPPRSVDPLAKVKEAPKRIVESYRQEV